MRPFYKAFIAGFVAVMLSISLAPKPAHAALSDCTNFAGTFCLWKDGGAGGSVWRQTPAQVSGCVSLVGFGWNDQVTTVRNNASGYVLRLWDNSNCTGGPVEAFYGYTYDFTGNAWNNRFSAVSKRFA